MVHSFLRRAALGVVLSAAVSAWFVLPTHGGEAADMSMVEPQTLKFAPIAGAPACVTAAPVRGDPTKGASILLVKLADGCRVPWHWHTANEQLMVVSGTGTLEMKDGKKLRLRAGAYASLPGRQIHQAACSKSCMFFNSADTAFDIHYVDETGKEIAADEALKKRTPSKAQKK
ncbi:MAG TPA: cupin domain-containing protein [Candidatus Binatia bacterium]|jgi:quercetin dioxygenase-like cupin family protein